jgi:hypothetical protein
MYLQLPQGLSKIRYEQEAWKTCQMQINTLRNRGFRFIPGIVSVSYLISKKGASFDSSVYFRTRFQISAISTISHSYFGDDSLKT